MIKHTNLLSVSISNDAWATIMRKVDKLKPIVVFFSPSLSFAVYIFAKAKTKVEGMTNNFERAIVFSHHSKSIWLDHHYTIFICMYMNINIQNKLYKQSAIYVYKRRPLKMERTRIRDYVQLQLYNNWCFFFVFPVQIYFCVRQVCMYSIYKALIHWNNTAIVISFVISRILFFHYSGYIVQSLLFSVVDWIFFCRLICGWKLTCSFQINRSFCI